MTAGRTDRLRALVVGTGFGCRIQVPALRGAGYDVVGLVGSDPARTAERAAANGLDRHFVDLDRAIPCGLVLNELASNSVKHAFPEGRLGEVWIDLRRVDPATIGLSVRDNGAGLPADWETRVERSLGVQLVTDLARQLGGRLAIGPDARFEITFPAEFQTRPALPRG